MSREWGLVALSIAIMVMAGAMTANAYWGQPFDVGPLGQWASAIGTITAVWVAVKNTQKTIEATANREAQRQRAADKAYLTALATLATDAQESIMMLDEKLKGVSVTPAAAKRYMHGLGLDMVASSLDKMPLHSAPSHDYVAALSGVRTAAFNAARKLETIKESGAAATVSFAEERVLIDDLIGALKEAFVAEGIDFDFEVRLRGHI